MPLGQCQSIQLTTRGTQSINASRPVPINTVDDTRHTRVNNLSKLTVQWCTPSISDVLSTVPPQKLDGQAGSMAVISATANRACIGGNCTEDYVHHLLIVPNLTAQTRYQLVWQSGIVVSALALITKVSLRWARLALRWATVSGFNSRCRTLISICNQPATQDQLSLPSLWGRKWVPPSARKAKAGMVHSISRCTWGVQVKLWDPLRTCAIPECLSGVITTRCCTNPHLPLPSSGCMEW